MNPNDPVHWIVKPGMEGVALAIGFAIFFCLVLWFVNLAEAETARKRRR